MRTLILAIALGVTACGSDDIVGPRDFARLAEAEARWNARGFADYSYEIRTLCFCPPEVVRWTRVSVQNGVVVDAVPVETDPYSPVTPLTWWDPIDSVFADLRRHMTGDNSYLEAIVVSFDDELGYPTSIEYRAKPTIADGSTTYNLRNVVPLN